MRQRTNPIWTIPKDELEVVVAQETTLTDILRHFGLESKAHNHRTLKKRLAEDNIDYSHIPLGRAANRGRTFPDTHQQPLEELLVRNSNYSSQTLRKRLIDNGLFAPKCDRCRRSEWRGGTLVMRLDHINKVYDDNRLENLRLLCPNCYSQRL